jgi:kumamolisin
MAANADPETGYKVTVDGEGLVIGGTSAVAPLMAGFVALANERLGRRAGYINPSLYTAEQLAFRDVTLGTNGAFSAGPGWDACTGLGSPLGERLISALHSDVRAREPAVEES